MEADLPSLKREVLRLLDLLGQSKMKRGPLREIAEDLYGRSLITRSTRDKPSSKEIVKDLKTRTEFQQSVKDLQKHCSCIIDAFELCTESSSRGNSASAESIHKATTEIKELLDESLKFKPINQSLLSVDSGLSVGPSPMLERHRGYLASEIRHLPVVPEDTTNTRDEVACRKSLDHWVQQSGTEDNNIDVSSYQNNVKFSSYQNKVQKTKGSYTDVSSYQCDVMELSGHQNKQVHKTSTKDNIVGSSFECVTDFSVIDFDYLTNFYQQGDDKSGTSAVPNDETREITSLCTITSDDTLVNSQAAVQHKVPSFHQTPTKVDHLSDQVQCTIVPTFLPFDRMYFNIPSVPSTNVSQNSESQCEEKEVQVDHISAPRSSGIVMHAVY